MRNANASRKNLLSLLLLTKNDINKSFCTTGQQEYSSRQAGITTGIVLACLIPILLVVVCVGYRTLKGQKEQREEEEAMARYQRFAVPLSRDFNAHLKDLLS